MSAHEADDSEDLRAEVAKLKQDVKRLQQKPVFYTDEIDHALAEWLKVPKNLRTLVNAVNKQVAPNGEMS